MIAMKPVSLPSSHARSATARVDKGGFGDFPQPILMDTLESAIFVHSIEGVLPQLDQGIGRLQGEGDIERGFVDREDRFDVIELETGLANAQRSVVIVQDAKPYPPGHQVADNTQRIAVTVEIGEPLLAQELLVGIILVGSDAFDELCIV